MREQGATGVATPITADGNINTPIPLSRFFVFYAIAILGCAADLWTKHIVFQWPTGPGQHGEYWLVENFVGIQHALNKGALFGMGQGQVKVFATLSIVAALGIQWWLFVAKAARDKLLTVALAAVTGGIFGNLYDRLGYGLSDSTGKPIHAVRDWILFCYYEHIWPNFNIADCLLVVGAITLGWHAFWYQEPNRENTNSIAVDERQG